MALSSIASTTALQAQNRYTDNPLRTASPRFSANPLDLNLVDLNPAPAKPSSPVKPPSLTEFLKILNQFILTNDSYAQRSNQPKFSLKELSASLKSIPPEAFALETILSGLSHERWINPDYQQCEQSQPQSFLGELQDLYRTYLSFSDCMDGFNFNHSFSLYSVPQNPLSIELSNQFTLTRDQLHRLTLNFAKKMQELTWSELIQLSMQDSPNALTGWAEEWLNWWNRLSYAHPDIYKPENLLANLFTHNPIINTAIAKMIEQACSGKTPIQVTELGSSSVPNRYEHFSKLFQTIPVHYTATNFTGFDASAYTALETGTFQLNGEALDLLKPFPNRPQNERQDVLLATYVFDSIAFPEDHTYFKEKGHWYKRFNRIIVTDKHPRRVVFLDSIQNGTPIPFNLEDFKHLSIESVYQEVSIQDEPHGKLIKMAYAHTPSAQVVFPGGLIQKVDEAFQTMLYDDGVFIIGDVANCANQRQNVSHNKTGIAAMYKIENYELAAQALREKGYEVQLQRLSKFISAQLGEDWVHSEHYTQDEKQQIMPPPSGKEGTCMLIVRKKPAPHSD